MNVDNNNRIRVINMYTGEVRETSASVVGVKSLSNVLNYEMENYEKHPLYVDRDIKQDIVFEGHPFFIKLLEKEFEQKLKKV